MTDEPVQRVMHEMPYGLYIVGSSEPDGKVNGMMADWVMQVSFDPRLVAVAFENNSHTLANLRERPHFSVNLLAQDVESMELARSFAQPYSGAKVSGRKGDEATKVHYKLDGLEYRLTEHGCPVLQAVMAWMECEVQQFLPIGDHTLAVGRVLDGRVEREAEPLTSTFTGWTYSG
ncbi:MAG TPA: flavin reductase family protein [Dehalococcoidia bacterium]|nr:flavin reductase family protein [Dehalococcoidia bacterium]